MRVKQALKQQFMVGEPVRLAAVVELRRGKPQIRQLHGLECHAGINQGFQNLIDVFSCGLGDDFRRKQRLAAFEFGGAILDRLPYYRLNLNLTDQFTFLLENI